MQSLIRWGLVGVRLVVLYPLNFGFLVLVYAAEYDFEQQSGDEGGYDAQ